VTNGFPPAPARRRPRPLRGGACALAARIAIACWGCLPVAAQTSNPGSAIPRVSVPVQTARPAPPLSRSSAPSLSQRTGPTKYPWKQFITCTIFWVGEEPTQNNPTPNDKSSWDTKWVDNFGGYDDPDPAARIADPVTGDFRPKAFVPGLNPFYVALPYNDVLDYKTHKPEASRVIPWFAAMRPEPGDTVCKGRWVQIYRGRKSCYAQWEDCGPWETDDWPYVFGNKPPKTNRNGAAGIDLSPAVRDYLGLKSGDKVHWRFVEASAVPPGPWLRYGRGGGGPAGGPGIEAQRQRLEQLRLRRDAEFRKKPLNR
jgi:hypothetical protein